MKELHVQIGKEDELYFVDILESDTADDWFERPQTGFPCQLTGTEQELQEIGSTLLKNGPERTLTNLGNQIEGMYDFLCGPKDNRNDFYKHWTSCINTAEADMRTVLHIATDRDELLLLPWELAGDTTFGEYPARFIMNDGSTHSLIRVSWAEAQLMQKPKLVAVEKCQPLRVLMVVGVDETEGDNIHTSAEALDVDLTIQRNLPWYVEFRVLRQPNLKDLMYWCRRWQPHVFHFVGHGGDTPEPHLLLNPADKPAGSNKVEIKAADLPNLFGDHVPQLVILNACRTGLKPALRNSRSRASLGFAKLLIGRGVPAVISIQGDINGKAAASLMGEFYAQLSGEKPVPVDLALAAAREKLGQRPDFGNKWDWGLPAIYLSGSLTTDDLLTMARIVPPLEEGTLQFLDKLMEQFDSTTQLPLPQAIRLQVGYDGRRLDLEKRIFHDETDQNHPKQPIIAVHGEEKSGKTSLVIWLALNCLRFGHRFIYADFANSNLSWWDALRLLRDGRLQKDDHEGRRLENDINPDVDFNRFNYALNLKEIADYEKTHAIPAQGEALAEAKPEADLQKLMEENGAVAAGEDPKKTIFEAFRQDLRRLAGEEGLVIFLDHVDRLSHPVVQELDKHLISPLVGNPKEGETEPEEPAAKIQFVVARDTPVSASATPDHWDGITGPPDKERNPSLDGFPGEEVLWLSKIWARRYYEISDSSVVRLFKRDHPNVELELSVLDELLAAEPRIKDAHQVLPGQFVGFLTNEWTINDYLKKMAGID